MLIGIRAGACPVAGAVRTGACLSPPHSDVYVPQDDTCFSENLRWCTSIS